MILSTTPAPESAIDQIWSLARAGAIDWAEVQRLQDAAMPQCVRHGRPVKITDNGGMCVECVEELVVVENGG